MTEHADLPSPPQMDFGITSRYKDCLSRQIGEALRFNYSKDVILNSKGEYLSNTISRLFIEEDAWERRERSRVEEEQDKLIKEEESARKRKEEDDRTSLRLIRLQETRRPDPIPEPRTEYFEGEFTTMKKGF